jgi:hypothetical protein
MAKTPKTNDILEQGLHGRPDGPVHTAPLVKDAARGPEYGPGTYGNDQFDPRTTGTAAPAPPPEGHEKPVPRRHIAGKPDTRRRDQRYGRDGENGVG